ncbi:MAG: hypothetical protein IPL23_25275 [Saprospiraceae bacterium]|nr:hypothetical protein [Saprospiraceae bacterium]
MKKLLFAAALLFAFTITGFSQDISGKWKGTAESPQGTFELEFMFKKDGIALTGTVTSSFGEIELTNGKIDDKEISFDVAIQDFVIHNVCEFISEDLLKVKSDMSELTVGRVKE